MLSTMGRNTMYHSIPPGSVRTRFQRAQSYAGFLFSPAATGALLDTLGRRSTGILYCQVTVLRNQILASTLRARAARSESASYTIFLAVHY